MTNVQVGAEGDLVTIRVDMAEVAKELTRQLEQCQQANEEARDRWEQSEWFLGEARATIARLEAQLQAEVQARATLEAGHRETAARLQEAEQQRGDFARQLDELRRTVESPSERRRSARTRRGDITVELQRPDGTVLFQGPLRDLSRTGMGFACEQLADGAPELLWVTFHPDGQERPIEAIARLAWLRQEDSNGNYAGGCELLDVSPGSRGAFEEVLQDPA